MVTIGTVIRSPAGELLIDKIMPLVQYYACRDHRRTAAEPVGGIQQDCRLPRALCHAKHSITGGHLPGIPRTVQETSKMSKANRKPLKAHRPAGHLGMDVRVDRTGT